MKKLKSVAVLLFCCVLFVSLHFSADAAGTCTISINAPNSVTTGYQVTVTINLSGSEKIGGWDIALQYDAALLDYVSGADGGGGGAVILKDSIDYGVSSKSFSLVFKAKKIGKATFSINNPNISDFASDGQMPSRMNAGNASKSINIVAPPAASTVNTLSSLLVSPGELSPEFQSGILEYSATVPYEVTSVAVSATPSDSKATVTLEQAELLQVGENQILVHVTAQSGAVRTYTIHITREKSAYAGVTAEMNGQEYEFAYDPAELTPPPGFTASFSTYQGKEILAFVSEGEGVCLVYLISGENASWYVYNRENESFLTFVQLGQPQDNYVILPAPVEELPQGFTGASLSLEEEELTVYQTEKLKKMNIYLVYAMRQDGKIGFYYFNAETYSFLPYFAAANREDLEVMEGMTTLDLVREKEFAEANATHWEIIAIALLIGIVLLVVALILVCVFKGKRISKSADAAPAEEDAWLR